MLSVSIGPLIKEARKSAGLTQEALAEKIGVSTQVLKDYEGGRKKPGRDRLPALAAATGRPVGFFFAEDEGAEQATVTADIRPDLTTEQRLLTMLERQQDIVEKQRLDIASLTDAIRLQQAAFLQEREFQQKLALRRDDTVDELRAEIESLKAQLRPSRGRQQLLDAPVPPGRAGAS